MRVQCMECGCLHTVESAVWSARRKNGLPYTCHDCGRDLFETGDQPKTGRSDNQKRSRGQEKRAARRYGAHRQAGSGSSDNAKGDLRDPGRMRGECKFTSKQSFSLKLEELLKLEREASSGEHPLFEIEFQGQRPFKRYVVLPDWVYVSLINKERQ